ncbi:MAG: dynamin family protein [Kiritimatiellae bacterium]|nr:dynamin family protein [Kiritimatiellia bacterium]
MIQRNKFDEQINVISDVTSAHPDTTDFQRSLAKLTGTRDCFDVKVMFVGHFNAGKSALLNRLIDREDFLEEAQNPQTAVATELKYGEEERYHAYLNSDKGIRCVQLKDYRDFSPDQCDHVEYQLPATALKELADFTIVDTPGFDSGIEKHTKALNAYIGQGSAYLLIVDVEDGEITQTSMRFLEEIVKYSPRIAVVLNKCDKGIEENRQLIQERIEETLRDNGFDCPVIATSKFDEEATRKLISLIGKFDAQDVFDEQMHRRIIEECVSIRNLLQITLDGLYVDTFDADKSIKKLETAKRFLNDSFEHQRKKFEQETNHQTQDIIDEIRAELLGKSTSIANALVMGGVAALEPIIVETIRPVIIEALHRTSDEHLEAIVKSLDFTSVMGQKDGKSIEEIITNTAKDIKKLIDNGTFTSALTALAPKDDGKNGKDDKNGKGKDGGSGKNIYRVVTGIAAIATNVIAPWMEVVIILLPDIMALFSKMFGESELEKARRTFETVILPQITSRLYAPIDNAVQQSQTILLDAMTQTATEKLEALEQSIQEAQAAKAEKVSQFENYRKTLENQIAVLHNVEDTLEE